MYRAVVFDLDGTLVQTEKLKAISYARVAVELRGEGLSEEEVIEEFKEVVGRSRKEVSEHLMSKFGLEEEARSRMEELDVSRPWQAFAHIRLQIYDNMLADPAVIRELQWSHNIELLKRVRDNDFATALATTSYCKQAMRILDILELRDCFDFVASRDDVERTKPDPEVYLLVASEIEVPTRECLVIEDSPSGVQAATAAGMDVLAVTTPFTRNAFRTGDLLDRRWVVDEPSQLPTVVWERLVHHQRETHGG